ncbi:MAG: Fe(3+) ABC transporter substrate-binding protein [Gammaproteobacteria bacterium]|nr:MAG: Fe(3+) ABC transporter substrate-binding protein [Gammaproteobacteria bacterium]
MMRSHFSRQFLSMLALALVFSSVGSPALAADGIVVYSARKEHLVKPLFDAYQQKTGVEIKYITDKAAPLLARLQAEGKNSPADMLITVDAGNLWQAAEKGVLAPVRSVTLEKNIPEHLRDAQGRWFGLSIRARTIVYATDRVKDGELTTYEDLADPKWKGRLCLRTSKKVYNQSLVAMMIAQKGEAEAEKIVSGWVSNLATAPFSNDTKTMQAIAAGQCDVGIVNTYYYGRLMKKEPGTKLALFWPNQNDRGVHVNISGAGVTRHAKNSQQAIKLIEWLSGSEAQKIFASLNMEYPANLAIEPDATVSVWGTFKQDQLNVAKAGELQASAVMLMDRAGYK